MTFLNLRTGMYTMIYFTYIKTDNMLHLISAIVTVSVTVTIAMIITVSVTAVILKVFH